MVAEFLPFGVARFAVLLAGAVGPALVDELSVVADDLLGVDRDVCLGRVEIEVASSFAAMWTGRPPLTVSVEKILRKSWGVNLSGVPSTSTMPACRARSVRSSRIRLAQMTCSRCWEGHWNRCGSGGPKTRS
ncbi:hypothetical protein CLM62_08145 [Streptomyces sp. SA15]|nr:hypothetical protein CLM62_08145 [Streptomyces sp. SA15]